LTLNEPYVYTYMYSHNKLLPLLLRLLKAWLFVGCVILYENCWVRVNFYGMAILLKSPWQNSCLESAEIGLQRHWFSICQAKARHHMEVFHLRPCAPLRRNSYLTSGFRTDKGVVEGNVCQNWQSNQELRVQMPSILSTKLLLHPIPRTPVHSPCIILSTKLSLHHLSCLALT